MHFRLTCDNITLFRKVSKAYKEFIYHKFHNCYYLYFLLQNFRRFLVDNGQKFFSISVGIEYGTIS